VVLITYHVKVKVAQSCPTLCDPMDSTVPGILKAKILEWVTFPFSNGYSQPRDWTQVSCIAGGFFTSWATRETQEYWSGGVAYPFSSGSSWLRNWTGVSYIVGGFFTNWGIREAQYLVCNSCILWWGIHSYCLCIFLLSCFSYI